MEVKPQCPLCAGYCNAQFFSERTYSKMENTKKLTGKDLINVGIYTAMTLVIFFVVGLLTALPVVYPFLFIIWPIVCGIPMMLYYTKIQKFGMLTITGIIGGIFFYLIGYG